MPDLDLIKQEEQGMREQREHRQGGAILAPSFLTSRQRSASEASSRRPAPPPRLGVSAT
jgi:hypothetical protein